MPKAKNLQPALDACQNQLALTFGASDTLDTKALGIIGFDIAMLIYILQSSLRDNVWTMAVSWCFFAVSLGLSIAVIWPKDYVGAIVDLKKHPEYLDMNQPKLILQLLADTQEAISINTKYNNRKSKWCAYSIVGGLFWILFIAGCIV